MLLRNVNLGGGLCNGTRMIIRKLMSKLIEAQIITCTRVGEKVYIPRIPLTHKDPNYPFIFKRKQFLVKLCYAMTINKSQGLSLNKIGVYLPQPIFDHGQLYGALSRATSPHGLKILMKTDPEHGENRTKDIVYKEFLNRISIIEGDVVQANMEAPEINYFKGILIPGKTYRIYGFTCIPTENWQQTLQKKVSLSFTTSTGFDVIEDDGFPKHYFDFISYNQLPSRVIDPLDKTKKPQPVLIDYIGCYISSTNTDKIGNPNRNRSIYRKIEIQNLNRNSLELTLWGNLAESFNKEAVDAMEKLVLIAVSSCRVSRFRNSLQLSATPATYYYIDPNIPELQQYKAEYREAFNLNPPLQIIRQAFKDKEREKFHNRYPLAVLMAEPMEPFDQKGDVYHCRVHGPVESPANRYNFKAYITDNTYKVMMTFFTPKGNDVVGTDCDTLVKSLENPDPKEFPKEIKAIVGKKHIFQFHFNTGAKQGPHEFIFNDILDKDEQPKQIEAKVSGSTSQEKELDAIHYPKTSDKPMVAITSDLPATEPENINPSENITTEEDQLEDMATPPSTYKGMQTRSKSEAISKMNRRSAKRPLFPDEQPDNKKKKN
ncbi:hypothetical protein CTI12_AA408530 [Artemisia annua]|uniref:Nucleic acid-binding, OB-fold protein n=1 Tax=Artemisia annua TaxID=35608 RepID=A0A2U1M053_ARTAN|nr:hypothetical protein CTI12_AA408530 [Artemisia annua]